MNTMEGETMLFEHLAVTDVFEVKGMSYVKINEQEAESELDGGIRRFEPQTFVICSNRSITFDE